MLTLMINVANALYKMLKIYGESWRHVQEDDQGDKWDHLEGSPFYSKMNVRLKEAI